MVNRILKNIVKHYVLVMCFISLSLTIHAHTIQQTANRRQLGRELVNEGKIAEGWECNNYAYSFGRERTWIGEKMTKFIAYLRQGVGREMARCSYTLTCCLSKLRSSLEAGKKLLRVWLQYVNRVAKVPLYSSFEAPLVLLWSPYSDSEETYCMREGYFKYNGLICRIINPQKQKTWDEL